MEKNMKAVLFCSILATAFAFQAIPAVAQTPTCTLIVHIDGFRNQKGDAGVTLFTSPDGWPEQNDKAFEHGSYPFSGNQATVSLNVPSGRYSIAVLHDENSNHKLDRNFLGFPKEGFGFSNNPKVRLIAPDFDTAAMQVGCPTTEILVHLIYK
jgi:uncharacterized protein (DUF2141 family)